MKNLILSVFMALAGASFATGPTNTPTALPTQTPNATQTPHVVVFDNAKVLTMTAGTSTPWSCTFTVGTGASAAMLVHVFEPNLYTPSDHVTSLSFGGVNLVRLEKNTMNFSTSNVTGSVETFYMLMPSAGLGTLTINMSVSSPSETVIAVSTYFNVWYLANISAVCQQATGIDGNSNYNNTTTLYAGFTGGVMSGAFAQDTSTTNSVLAEPSGFTNRVTYNHLVGVYPGISIDDIRSYSATALPVTWTYPGYPNSMIFMNYVELVPR